MRGLEEGVRVYSKRDRAFGVITAVRDKDKRLIGPKFVVHMPEIDRIVERSSVDLQRAVTVEFPWDEARAMVNHPAAKLRTGIYDIVYGVNVSSAVNRIKRAMRP